MKRRNRSKLDGNTSAASLGKSVSTGGGQSAQPSSGWSIALAASLIVLAVTVAYSNCLCFPFVLDDQNDIVNNASINHLWPIWDIFVVSSDGRAALHGRPVVNFSLAVDYAIGGLEPFPYHVTNLLIHVLGGLTLFGIVRRTLLRPGLGGRFAAATSLALAVALIWSLHPLQTGAVTYVTQRYESMMGLFYLLALYAALRCGTSAHPRRWGVAAVAAALLSMGCKEVAVSIPITILLYDRAFLAGSFREALRRRWGMYVGLAAAWAAFAVLFVFSYSRGRWAGYGLPISWIEYARSQFGVILHYLRLSCWPRPLVLDYGWPVARTAGEILPGAIVVGGLAVATTYALIRWPKWGFVGAWFFLILAPTSSVMPLADLAFEHRMYLPLAAVVAGVVMGGYLIGQWFVGNGRISRRAWQVASGCLLIFAGVVFGILTFQRNVDYRNEVSIWEDTVAKAPDNARAHSNLGVALYYQGRMDEAIVQYQKALELEPNHADVQCDFGLALDRCGRFDEATLHFRKALELKPDFAVAHNGLALALARDSRFDEAIAHYQKALEITPQVAETHFNLGNAFAGRGRLDEAMTEYRKSLEIKADYADAHNNLGLALAGRGRVEEAIEQYQQVLTIQPDNAEALNHLAWVRATCPEATFRDGPRAIELAGRAVELSGGRNPNYLDTLAAAQAEAGRFSEAVETARKALELATQQTQQKMVESIRVKIPLYQAGTPFREPPTSAATAPTRP